MSTLENLTTSIPNKSLSSSSQAPFHKDGMSLTTAIMFSLLCIVGTLGNSLVILVYTVKARKRFRKLELMLRTIAIGDLLASFINPLLFIYWRIVSKNKWHFGKIGCKIIPAIGPTANSFTLLVVILMAIDRDRAVITPLKTQYEYKTIKKVMLGLLCLTILGYIPFIASLEYKNNTCESTSNKAISIAGFILLLLIDSTLLVIISITTYRFAKELFLTKKGVSRHGKINKSSRLTYVVVAIGFTFVICIYPRDTVLMYQDLKTIFPESVNPISRFHDVFNMVKFLHVSNSCINVFIYCITNPFFRKDVLDLLKKGKTVIFPAKSCTRIDSNKSENGRHETYHVVLHEENL